MDFYFLSADWLEHEHEITWKAPVMYWVKKALGIHELST
jgi:hypothetical protein